MGVICGQLSICSERHLVAGRGLMGSNRRACWDLTPELNAALSVFCQVIFQLTISLGFKSHSDSAQAQHKHKSEYWTVQILTRQHKLYFVGCMFGADGCLLMVYYGDSGFWYPQHATAVEKFLFTLSSLIVVVSCIIFGGQIRPKMYSDERKI